jgi:pyruvate dehydrogenase E1 component alpha subunit
VFSAPVVFFCENNRWAISMRRDQQTASPTIAGKAQAYGFEGLQVDGNDPLAVREAVERSLERARGSEPVLIESLTYRQGAHTTADEPDRYRAEPEDLPDWRTADPLDRFESFLLERGVIEEEFVSAASSSADGAIDAAIETAENESSEPPGAVFDDVYESLPPRLREQRAQLQARQDGPS